MEKIAGDINFINTKDLKKICLGSNADKRSFLSIVFPINKPNSPITQLDNSVLLNSAVSPSQAFSILEQLEQFSHNWPFPSIRANHIVPSKLHILSLFPLFGISIENSSIDWSTPNKLNSSRRDQQNSEDQQNSFSTQQLINHFVSIYPNSSFSIFIQHTPSAPSQQIFTNHPSSNHPNIEVIQDEPANKNSAVCIICYINKPCIAAPCNHLNCCASCAVKIKKSKNPSCPTCRGPWTNLKQIFL